MLFLDGGEHKTWAEFSKAWERLGAYRTARYCFIDLNKTAQCWAGIDEAGQGRFGDCPGRSFGVGHVFLSLASDEEAKKERRRIEDRLRKGRGELSEVIELLNA